MLHNIDIHGHEWITKTTAGGRSVQATQVAGRWYVSGSYGFPNDQEARKTYHDPEVILEHYGSGLVTVLIPTDMFEAVN